MLTLVPRTASAVQYEIFVDIETEEDLYDLLLTEQISRRTFDALLELHQTRVDLNRADRSRLYLLPNLDYGHVDRILAYREAAGMVRDLGDLIAAGVLEAHRARAVHAFVTIGRPRAPKSGVTGFTRIQARWTGRYDQLPPAAALQSRVTAVSNLDAGLAAALTRARLTRPRWDASRNGLSSGPERTRFEVPKVYLEWQDDSWEIVAGTYRIGFGQRLTFDVTDQVAPNGFFGDYEIRRDTELRLACRRGAGELEESPCPSLRVRRITPDYSWTSRLTGVAVGLGRVPLGSGWLQSYAWGSFQVHRLQQTELVDVGACEDPRRDDDPACKPPPLYVLGLDPRAPAPTATFATVPAAYGEGLAGANASYFWSARRHLGITGYGAFPTWLVRGVSLGFQEVSRRPFGGRYGAVGVDAAFGFGRQDFFAEVARSFDGQPEGGGFGIVARSVTTLDGAEVDVSLRYYAPSFANPYARPISAPDELDGLRARDEAGLRVRSTVPVGPRADLRVFADAWRKLSSGALDCSMFVRVDFQVSTSFSWAVWSEYRKSGGQRVLVATQLAYAATRRLRLSTQLQHRSRLFAPSDRRRPHDVAAIVHLTGRPADPLRFHLRVRYDFEDVANNHRLAQALWAQAETAFTLRDRDALRVRYDFRVFLDRRESTRARVPNPEHWLSVEYVLRY